MWELGLRCHRRMRGGVKVGGMSKSEIVISGEELSSARKRDVRVGGYVGRVNPLMMVIGELLYLDDLMSENLVCSML